MTFRIPLIAGGIAVVLAGCGQEVPSGYPGYVEAEYVRVAAPLGGSLAKLAVQRGDRIAAGAPLFALENEQERAARAEAESRVQQADSTLADLEKARRPPEIAAVRAQLAQAQAALKDSEAALLRTQKLVAENFVSRQQLDSAAAARDRDQARVHELESQVAVVNLPARSDTIAAARAEAKAARDALAQAQWRLDQKAQTAPAAALVADTLYRQGEWVAPGAPVVSLLPPGNVKVRFFVPEPSLASLRIGGDVTVRCDGCPAPIAARISFIAPQAEYTPPVIYSRENRAKLVFMVEARAEPPEPMLHPGLPVEVRVGGVGFAMSDAVIDVHGLTKRYGGRAVVDDFAIRVERGQIFGFLGPNGSGKTTTIRMLCGLLKPDAGSGTCLGYDLIAQSAAIKRNVGYMTQRFSLYEDLSIAENLDFIARIYEVPSRAQAVAGALDRLGLTSRRAQLAGTLSGGWKQRLALAACLLHSPQLLLLDEPTAGVDPKARRDFWEQIHDLAAEGITVLVSTHYMDEAERCHRLAYIAYGRLLVEGTADEVIASSGLTTFVVSLTDTGTARALSLLSRELRDAPGVDTVIPFGTTLHVSGRDAAALERAEAMSRRPGFAVTRAPTSLEDVFVSLMQQASADVR